MRATNFIHSGVKGAETNVKDTNKKNRKGLKAFSAVLAVLVSAAALIVPTTTLAPGVDATSDSRVASYSIGNIDKFSAVITNNCVEVTTAPVTEPAATKAEITKAADSKAAASSKTESKTEAEKKSSASSTAKKTASSEAKKTSSASSSSASASSNSEQSSKPKTESKAEESSVEETSGSTSSYSGGVLLDIANADPGYSPSYVSLSAYDRAKTERLVMGEGGTMGFEGCALIAQSIRDAMNRSGTTSIDEIINDYQYFGSTDIEPNQDVKDAVSFIFDQNGSAVQHRIICFYIGYSSWHETQTFIYELGGVRFFDLNAA